MISLSVASAAGVGALLAVLVIAACVALFVGLRARADAAAEAEGNRRFSALIESSPAQAMVVRADGRVEMPQRLADWFGLASPAADLRALSEAEAGLAEEDASALAYQVSAAQKAGRPFTMQLRLRGSGRTLTAIGMRAPDTLNAPGGVALWFLDTTDSEMEIARLTAAAADARGAFDGLTGLLEAAPMPMWYRDAELRLVMVNTAYVHAVEGKNAEDVVARQVELIEGGRLGGPLTNAAIARDTGEPQMAAMPATIGGARRMLQVHDVPLPMGGVAGYAVDVEDLEQARAGNKRSAEAQRATLDRLSAAVAQFSADRNLVFCNQPFRRIFAMKNEWLADRPEFDRVLDRMREANRLPDVRDFPAWRAERREWFHAEGPVEESWTVPGGIHLRVVVQPLPEGGLLLIFEDRTEQLQLASEHDRLQRVRTATLDSLFEAVAVFGQGRLQLWNKKFGTVWDFEEGFVARHPQLSSLAREAGKRLAKPARAELISDLVRIATGERQQRSGDLVFADGRHFEVTAVPLPDGNALFTMLDITDRAHVERALRDRNEALEAADRVKTSFVANMSYELRTPLTSIKGFAEMLHAGLAGPLSESGVEYSEAILDSVARLSALVDDVLDLTQNEGAIPRERIDLELVAHAAAEAIVPMARRKSIDLAVDVLGSAGSVLGDPRRLRQGIEHLLHHAVSGTPEGGRVLLHVDGTEADARIVVSDDGPGMDPEAVSRAFDRFAQPGITRGGERALGLGLPLAKQFFEAHGGKIELISEQGEGTLVTVELPRG